MGSNATFVWALQTTGSAVSSGSDQPLSPLSSGTNITDAPTAADLQVAYEARRQQYASQVEQYKDAVNVTNGVNKVAVNLVQKVRFFCLKV